MQILNITPTIRPSKSLTTGLFPILTHESATYNLLNPTVLIRDLVYDQNHEISTVYGVGTLKVVLREPLIDITDPDVLMVGYSITQPTVKLRTTVIDERVNDPVQSATYTLDRPTVKLHTVVVAHSQSEPVAETRYTLLGVTAKLT